MKLKFYFFKKIFILCILTGSGFLSKSQVLSAGDIAFTGYYAAASTTDMFSFVLLVNIPAGTVINFTDNGWLTSGAFRAGEQTITWTAGSALVAGREITISGTTSPSPLTPTAVVSGSNINAGTCTGTMTSLSTVGDQILAYQGPVASPTFIAGIHMNVYSIAAVDLTNTDAATWDNTNSSTTTNSTNASALPPGLTTGTNAIWIGLFNTSASEFDNAIFNCTGPMATPSQVRNSVNNYSALGSTPFTGINWNTTNGAQTLIPPSGCAFLASIFPVKLSGFTGSNMGNYINLQWQGENENSFNHYELERSFDGNRFVKIAGINGRGGVLPNSYSYNDAEVMQISKGNIYYRLKLVDNNGFAEYSTIVKIKTYDQGDFLIDHLPVPFSGSLAFSIISKKPSNATISISDLNGKPVYRNTTALQTGSNLITIPQTSGFANGIYILDIIGAEGIKKTMKLVKQ